MRVAPRIAPPSDRLPVAFLGTYPPRACGIATFTHHLVSALDEHGPVQPHVLAIADREAGDADGLVAAALDQHRREDYVEAARFVNASGIAALNVQHEYGIFGGEWGEMVLDLLRGVRCPAVTTLHTVLPSPPPEVRRITRAIADRSAVLTVMAKAAVSILEADYGLPVSKIRVVPHGIPDGPYPSSLEAKREAGLEARTVLSTFGLIGPNKGLEYAIRAVPRIARRDPSVTYLIVGQTHPGVVRHEGERYRESLRALAQGLGVAEAVRLDNRYLSDRQVLETLMATDVYLTPYLDPTQITSGTLTYAVGSGRPVVSTPYRYAQELLAGGRGLLVPFRDAEAIADAVLRLLDEPQRRAAIAEAGRRLRSTLQWSSVAIAYARIFEALARPERAPAAVAATALAPAPGHG